MSQQRIASAIGARDESKHRGLQGWIAVAIVLFAYVPSAMAGAGLVTTAVSPLQSNVTYSDPSITLKTYFGYTVTVGSDSTNTNTINNVRFTGSLGITDSSETASFSSADGITCTASGMSVECPIGQMRPGQSVTFTLFFNAPTKKINGVADNPTEDHISFTGITYYAEGTGGPNSVPQNSTLPWGATTAVELGTNNVTFVKSAVQKSGGTLFTGSGAAATPTDTWTTNVVVPATTTYTTADILETTVAVPLASNLADKSESKLTIPGQFAKLVITLRRDASTLLKGAKIASAKVYYSDPTHPDPRIDYSNFLVPPCTDTSYGALPQLGIPCINRRTEYTKRTAPTPDWEGDWEFEIFALDNGRYTN